MAASVALAPAQVREHLIAAAREGRPVSYSEMLGLLGYKFTRPLMRNLCKVLDRIDEDGAAAGEPPLAVLVVRESDGLPGQGWWVSRSNAYDGAWSGPQAREHVIAQQTLAFAYWKAR